MFFANFEDMSVESGITADQVYAKTGVPMKFTKVNESTTDAFASFVTESSGNKALRLTTTKPILFYQAEVTGEFGDIALIEPVRFYSGVGGWSAKIDDYFVKVYDIK